MFDISLRSQHSTWTAVDSEKYNFYNIYPKKGGKKKH